MALLAGLRRRHSATTPDRPCHPSACGAGRLGLVLLVVQRAPTPFYLAALRGAGDSADLAALPGHTVDRHSTITTRRLTHGGHTNMSARLPGGFTTSATRLRDQETASKHAYIRRHPGNGHCARDHRRCVRHVPRYSTAARRCWVRLRLARGGYTTPLSRAADQVDSALYENGLIMRAGVCSATRGGPGSIHCDRTSAAPADITGAA